jgi:hypothetical protein
VDPGGWPHGPDEFLLDRGDIGVVFGRDLAEEIYCAFRPGWPRQDRIHRDSGIRDGLGDAAGQCKLCRLGHAVMNHLGRDLQP